MSTSNFPDYHSVSAQEVVQLRMELAAAHATIHQLGENAAKAAERVAVLEAALCEALDALKFQPYRNTRTLQAIPRVEAALTEQPK